MPSLSPALAVAVHATVRDNGGPAVLGKRLGIRPAVLSNKANPQQTRNQLTLAEGLHLQQITNDHRILQAMARELGYIVVPLDFPPPSDVELLTLYARWQDAAGQTHHAIANAFEDRRITQAEQIEVERRFFDAACAGLTYIHRMGSLVQ
ncbi:MAG: phage regulatory CII family protein [Candidatus Competibacter denitrificans]